MSEPVKAAADWIAQCQALVVRIVEAQDSNEKHMLHRELTRLLMEKR